jgi:hypothetical protein
MITIFDNGGLETFKFELLTLQNDMYKHSQFITNYVENANIKMDFEQDIITGADFEIKHLSEINYLKDLIKPWYCLTVDGVTYEIPLGHYMLLSPTKNLNTGNVSRKISGYDLLKALDQDKTLVSQTFSEGTNVVSAIESLLDSVGTWVIYNIEPSDETLSEDISYELGRSKLFIINSLLNMINYYPLWVSGNGVYRGIPWSPTPNIAHIFEDNNRSLYEDNINLDVDYSDGYNIVKIIVNQLQQDTPPLEATLSMEDEGLAGHPFSYTSIGRYVTKIFQSEAVSQDYVDLRARRELRKMLELEEAISYKHAYITPRLTDGIPWQGDAYRFKNTDLGLDYIYKIVKQSYKLTPGVSVKSIIRRFKLYV